VWNEGRAEQRDLHTSDVVLDKAANGALTVDLDGHTIFPGLINAHDHLELNHYPRSKFRERYDNAHQWGEDMNARLDSEPYKSLRAYPLWDRLFIGGLKNLLCGATTVAHHNPPHKELWRKDFPVRVLRNYGWSHSLHFNTDEEVVRSYRATPKNWPWFIHLAEGTDDVAAGEYKRLKALGCVGPNTIIVHGVGMSYEDAIDFFKTIKGHMGAGIELVICPSTNIFLLDAMVYLRIPAMVASTMIGSDSRLTSCGDLLDELHFAYENVKIHPRTWVVEGVTHNAKYVLGLSNVGDLKDKYHADLIAINGHEEVEARLCNSRRADLVLVVRGGIPQIGNPDIMAKFPHIETVDAMLDGVPKRIHLDLARRIHQCRLKEPGLEVDVLPKKKFWMEKKA
jgi:hypothetical protein